MKNGRYEAAGSVFWYKDGRLHREDGPAIEWSDGSKAWYSDGTRHRLDGPAYESPNGRVLKMWLRHGKRHRVDGPAVEMTDGNYLWYINGTKVDISIIDYDGSRSLTDEEMTYLILSA